MERQRSVRGKESNWSGDIVEFHVLERIRRGKITPEAALKKYRHVGPFRTSTELYAWAMARLWADE